MRTFGNLLTKYLKYYRIFYIIFYYINKKILKLLNNVIVNDKKICFKNYRNL